MCYKTSAINLAYENGIRHCPCCGVQLVWKANTANVQRNLATVDHIVPKSIGGANLTENMYVMCRACNESRGNTCFVTYVVDKGLSKKEAEHLYKIAHITSVRYIIAKLMNQTNNIDARKLFKKQMKAVVKNYTNYFQDYLPEFDLLPRELFYK